MARSNIIGCCVGWIAFGLLFISLVTPWYLHSIRWHSRNNENECALSHVFFWAHFVCSSHSDGGCEDEPAFACNKELNPFWREEDNRFEEVFAPTLFLMLCSTVAALVVALFYSLRCCCGSSSTSKVVNVACLVLEVSGLLMLTAAIVYFAVALPKAWKDEMSDAEEEIAGPWESFLGHRKATFRAPERTGDLDATWLPVGWWFAVVGWPFFLATTATLSYALKANANHELAGYALLRR